MKYTTLNEIKKHNPCNQDGEVEDGGWNLLLHSLGKTKADDEPLSFSAILESNGIEDAVWALCTLPFKEQALFRADVAELVLPSFEKKRPNDKRPRKVIEALRLFSEGKISADKLRAVALYAYDVTRAATVYATDPTDSSITTHAACDFTAFYRDEWKEIEQLFIKHFCGGE